MFDKHITGFNENIIGLRDFIDLIEPYLTTQLEEHNKHIAPLLSLGLLNGLAAKKTSWDEEEKVEFAELKTDLIHQIKKIFNKEIDIELEASLEDSDNANDKKSFGFKINATKAPELNTHIDNSIKVQNHIRLLYKNSLISLLSSVEWFFSQILHFHYDKFPESAGIQKKTMTLSELKAFDSIDEAEKFLIDTKIEEVLRGNFESWITLLKTDLNLSLGYIDPIKNELIEIYQRRNLFVHNGGIVNSLYISKVHEDFRKGCKINEQLYVDKEYLDNAISKLQKTFILIASELWKKIDKSDKNRGSILTDIVYENLLKSRWDICEGLTYFINNDSELDITDKVVSQLNYWLCKKETNQYDSIKKEVDKVNFADKREIFQLGLLAIKDEKLAFFDLLPKVLNSEQLNTKKLEEFPIFRTMRETEEYQKFKESDFYKALVDKVA